MSGNGVTNFSFTGGNVLPNTITTATSGGDNINLFKDGTPQTGGKKHRKSCGKKRKSMRKIKKNKSKKNKSRKNTRRNRRK